MLHVYYDELPLMPRAIFIITCCRRAMRCRAQHRDAQR